MNKKDLLPFFAQYVRSLLRAEDAEKYVSFSGNQKYHFIIPLTYITPNYLMLYNFSLVSALTNLGHTVSIFLHDNNLLSHPQHRREVLGRRAVSISNLIEYMIEEVEMLLLALGTDMKNVKIIKSSDMWAALSQDRQSFLSFYSPLGDIRFYRTPESSEMLYSTAYHAIQRPFDVYFSENYLKLSKLGVRNPDFLITSQGRLESYRYIRNKMLTGMVAGPKRRTNPTFIISKPAFTLIHRDAMPSANMNVDEIKYIIDSSKLSAKDLALTFKNIVSPLADFLNVTSIIEPKLTMPKNPKNRDVAVILNEIMSAVWSKTALFSPYIKKDIYIVSKFDFDGIIEVLSSKPMQDALLYCDGKSTVSDVARRLGKQVSNTSYYLSKLRELGLITADKLPKVRFGRIIIDSSALGISTERSAVLRRQASELAI